MGFKFAIDRGGTFTDVYVEYPDKSQFVYKLLSEDYHYKDAPSEAIRRLLSKFYEVEMTYPIETKDIDWIRMGTTVATNALLERKGEEMAFCVTQGFKDLLHIGNQARPSIFDLTCTCPEVLYSQVVEVEERVVPVQEKCQLYPGKSDRMIVEKKLNTEKLKHDLKELRERGIKSIAVALMHSYCFADHELQVAEIAQGLGFTNISLSHKVMEMIKIVPRGHTACADAYLTPHIQVYLSGFMKNFKNNLKDVPLLFMRSDGGLTHASTFTGSHAILSGPAGGVVGYAQTSPADLPLVGFDMGGTSTDVSRYAGKYEHVFETTTAGISIQAPQLDINTVAAGGGSCLAFRAGLFVVGPESAGANPGPTCYNKGGPLTVTDANLVLGRLRPEHFPNIFGPGEDEPLNVEATREKFAALREEICEYLGKEMSVEEVALGFIDVANETMCRPIRALTQAKGHDTSQHALACFGGAGGQHACSIARSLGMNTVHVHKYSSILSAYGMALADVVHDTQRHCGLKFGVENWSKVDGMVESLKKECREKLGEQGFDKPLLNPFLHLRYEGTDCALMCPASHSTATCQTGSYIQSFEERYLTEFGFTLKNRDVIVDDVRVRGIGKSEIKLNDEVGARSEAEERSVEVYFRGGAKKAKLVQLKSLGAGASIGGPAILLDKNSTILVEPGSTAVVTSSGDIKIEVGDAAGRTLSTELDPIQLSIFSHRFMSTAEQMGRVLQRTSISVNIKERLDFSCAMFDAGGGLVANAPHIPVHLGAMQEAVKFQLQHRAGDLKDGDVLLSNHPCAGGSHLPDMTVITPVFYPNFTDPVFFVASRGHHADIGGLTPGSMPPMSQTLQEEGAAVYSFKLVEEGVFDEAGVTEILMEPGKYPGNSGTRNLADNISDLKAQVAANHRGVLLIQELMKEYGVEVVQAYMSHIQSTAEMSVRQLMKQVSKKAISQSGKSVLEASDQLDDGSPITLRVELDPECGAALFDFTGTSPQVIGNLNAPRAISLSAIIYCLRCMVGYDIPLNQGCLIPITIKIPKGSVLDPHPGAAVIGGNVLTSQRIVDVIFKAFSTCAASQGCMNNITFGSEEGGYYETVGGGAGAGPHWDGRSGVHTHMTNTRITDPEIIEQRYPVLVDHFSLRAGSGGPGLQTTHYPRYPVLVDHFSLRAGSGGPGLQTTHYPRYPVLVDHFSLRAGSGGR
ncbi:hypothetical protein ACHWQZ_G018478 [Mnemiopsis leidyi]